MAETWLLNETVTLQEQTFSIKFSSSGQNFNSFSSTKVNIFYDSTAVYDGKHIPGGGSHWHDEAYRTVTFETAPTGDLLTWLQANGTKQSNKLSVDLTTLSGWANLSAGNHTIKIKAKGTGYKESELSAGVVVSKAAGETWVLNDSDALTESNQDFTSLNFTSDSQSFVRIVRQYDNRPIPPVNSLLYYKSDGTYVTAVYTNDDGIAFWNRQAYRTLTFATPPTGDLLTWLQANGTKQS